MISCDKWQACELSFAKNGKVALMTMHFEQTDKIVGYLSNISGMSSVCELRADKMSRQDLLGLLD